MVTRAHTHKAEKKEKSSNRAAAAASDVTFLRVSTTDALSGSSAFIENT